MSTTLALLRPVADGRTAFWCSGCACAHVVTNAWTITPGERPTISPSVLVNGSMPVEQRQDAGMPRCHLFVRDGQLQFLADCDHALAGQTVPMEPMPTGPGLAEPRKDSP